MGQTYTSSVGLTDGSPIVLNTTGLGTATTHFRRALVRMDAVIPGPAYLFFITRDITRDTLIPSIRSTVPQRLRFQAKRRANIAPTHSTSRAPLITTRAITSKASSSQTRSAKSGQASPATPASWGRLSPWTALTDRWERVIRQSHIVQQQSAVR